MALAAEMFPGGSTKLQDETKPWQLIVSQFPNVLVVAGLVPGISQPGYDNSGVTDLDVKGSDAPMRVFV